MNDKDKKIESDNNSETKGERVIDSYYEKEDDKRRYPPLIFLTLVTTVGVMLALSLSFSAVKYLESNETINTIISNIKGEDSKDRYIITYAENIGGHGNGINLVDQFPISDREGKLITGSNHVFNFSLLVGKKTVGAYYELTAVPNYNNTLKSQNVKLYLEKNGHGVDTSYRNNGKVKVFSEYSYSKYTEAEGKVIYNGYITKEDVKKGKIDFVMRMWISEDVIVDSDYGNKTFKVKVNTYAQFDKKR